jgi:hypothetical protein
MINVNNITSTLAKLPDQALQQYAMMHKSDPYIMSLAVSESNRRKEMRIAQGAQGGMQEQPKVVDAAVAEMAPQAPPMPQQMGQPMPEDIGIGQLPAGDMEFAGGGILAFAEAGSIPGPSDVRPTGRYQNPVYGGTPSSSVEAFKKALESNKLTDAERAEARAKVQGPGGIAAAIKWLSTINERKDALDTERTNRIKAEQREGMASDARSRFAKTDERRDIPGSAPLPGQPSGNDPNESPYSGEGAPVVPAPVVPAPNPLATPVGIEQVAGPTVTNAAPVSMDYAGARAGLAGIKGFAPVTTELDEFEKQKKAAAQKGVNRAEEGLTREQKFQAEMGEYGAGKEKRLQEREAKLSKDEKSNYGLAFLEAGLAMMGGKDQNAFANISTGALKGLGSYKTGLAKLNDRKEKLFDAYDSLEDARRSDKKDRFARIEAAQDKISSAQTALENVSVDVLGKTVEMNEARQNALNDAVIRTANTEYNARSQGAQADANRATNADLARYRADTQRATTEAQISAGDRRTTAEIASREKVADMPSKEQRMYEGLGGGDLRKGMEIAAQIKAATGKDTATADFVKYVEAATKNADPTNPPNMDTLLQQFLAAQQRLSGAKLTSSLPQGAQTVK